MTIQVTKLPDAEPRDRHVAIGVFDGVHKGHQAVIDEADTVLTFDPHPLSVINPDAAPKLIMPFDVKRDVIDGLGVDELVVIPFDREFMKIPAEEFISRILVEQLGAKKVSVGENFRFGAKAKGTPQMLAEREEFETRIVPLVEVDGETVSSSRVRAWSRRGRSRRPCAASGLRSWSRGRWSKAIAADASSASPPRTWSPTTTWWCRDTASTPPSPTATRPRSM